jgi:hypothetical protein
MSSVVGFFKYGKMHLGSLNYNFWGGNEMYHAIVRLNFKMYFCNRCTLHLDITKVSHSPTDALFINLRKL